MDKGPRASHNILSSLTHSAILIQVLPTATSFIQSFIVFHFVSDLNKPVVDGYKDHQGPHR